MGLMAYIFFVSMACIEKCRRLIHPHLLVHENLDGPTSLQKWQQSFYTCNWTSSTYNEGNTLQVLSLLIFLLDAKSI